MTKQRSVASNLGLYTYAGAAIFLGVVGVVGPDVPLRVPLACIAGVIELAAGIALLIPRTARIGSLILTILYSVFTLLWLPKALVNLGSYDAIGSVFENFSLVAAGLVLCANFWPAGSAMARRQRFFVLLFGICPISFGIVHIIDMPGLLNWIPGWLLLPKMFWAYVTTLGFFAAAIAILTGIMAPLAAYLLTAEIIIFELLIWIPTLHRDPHKHFNWSANAICIAIAGAAWVVADSIRTAANQSRQNPREFMR